MGCHCVNAEQGDIQTIEETRVASFRKMLVAGTAIAAGLGWASQSVLAEPGGEVVAITGAPIFDATGKDPYRGPVVLRDGRIEGVCSDVKVPWGSKVAPADGTPLLPGCLDVHPP